MEEILQDALALESEQVRVLAGLWERRSFAQGSQVMGLSGSAKFLAVVLTGELSLGTLSSARIRLGPGEVVGELALLAGRGRTVEVYGEVAGELAILDYSRLPELERDEPALALALFKALARLGTSRLLEDFASPAGYVALVAHDGRKEDLLEVVVQHLNFFAGREIVATETTAQRIQEVTDLRVRRKVASGPRGGDQEVGSMISRGCVAAVFFFRNPLASWAHQADVDALMRLCDVHDVPLATNRASARALIALLDATGCSAS